MPYEQTTLVIRETLRVVFDEVDAWFDRPEGLRQFKPSSGGWSVDQVLEHITLTNHFLMLTLRKWVAIALRRASRGDGVPEGESDLQRLDVIGQRGSFAWVRPDHMEPTGQPTSGEVRATLRRQLDECLSLLDRMGGGEGSLCLVRMSLNDLGKIDLYQWLYFLAQHARRHLQQMAAAEREFQQSAGGKDERAMIHWEDIERYPGTLAELAGEVGDLRYDALASFLRSLAAKLESDGNADAGRGRPKLAASLRGGAARVMEAAAEIERAWSICAPHM
jgi:hypothetical protein